jgi:hypothetical protein
LPTVAVFTDVLEKHPKSTDSWRDIGGGGTVFSPSTRKVVPVASTKVRVEDVREAAGQRTSAHTDRSSIQELVY